MRLRTSFSLIATLAMLSTTVILAQDYGTPAAVKMKVEAAPKRSILGIVGRDTTMTLFIKHVNKAGLATTLAGKGPFTVFAPDNNAFNARTKEDLDAEHADSLVLISTMKYHVITGKSLSADDLMKMNGQTLTMDNGMTVPVTVMGNRVMIGGANVTGTETKTANGIIHVVDHVLIPGKELPMKSAMPVGK